MSNARAFPIHAMTRIALPCLVTFFFAFSAAAQSNNSNYIFLLASGFLCDPGDTSTCPATGKSANDDSYELSGAGMFDALNKSVKAAGPYTHKSPNGNVLETGVWLADELVSFNSYGAAPNALSRQGVPLGRAPFGPRRLPMISGPMPTGGLAVFHIRLLPMQGPPTNAVLQVNCALGDVPRERSVEGIRLAVERNNSEYSEEISGRVMFLAMTPGMNKPVKAPQEEKAPETSEQPHN